jgi:signal transduction histidine kinase
VVVEQEDPDRHRVTFSRGSSRTSGSFYYPPRMDGPGLAGASALRRLLDAVMTVGADLDLDVVLRRIVEVGVELVDARYGALGVLDTSRTGLSSFIPVGFDDDLRAAIGHLPEGHGILGLLIVEPRPLRLPDLRAHPDSYGFPPNHPPMTSFLGVPVFVRGEVYGNLYLTDKAGGEPFTEVDEELVVGLASAAGVAIDNARLHARVRELDVLEDRERIARDLHDTVIQRLFATGLSLQGAARLAQRAEVAERIQQAVDDIDVTVRQIRSAIFELQTTRVPGRSLRRELLAIGGDATNALGFEPVFRFEGPIDNAVADEVAEQLVAVLREALTNVARHAVASRVDVVVEVGGGALELTVTDDGIGFSGDRPGGHGLDNMARRAEALGGEATVAPGAERGTVFRWRVPVT